MGLHRRLQEGRGMGCETLAQATMLPSASDAAPNLGALPRGASAEPRQTGRLAGRQAGRQEDGQAGRQTGRLAGRMNGRLV